MEVLPLGNPFYHHSAHSFAAFPLFSKNDVDAVLYGRFPVGSHGDEPAHSLSGIHGYFIQSRNGDRESKLPTSEEFALPRPALPRKPDKDRSAVAGSTDLPDNLTIRQLSMRGLTHVGVFCKTRDIKEGTRFGPFTGQIVSSYDEDTVPDYSWEIFNSDGEFSHFVDGSTDPYNWMKIVNCARCKGEQNLVVIQRGVEIYYEACREISRGEELLSWYGNEYDKYFGLPIGMKRVDIKSVATTKDVITAEENTDEAAGAYPCDRCGKVFSYRYYRDKHLKYTKCVDLGNRRFPCQLCQRSFEKRDRLRIHVLHVHERHRPHACEVCDKRFSQSSSLNKHRRVHSGERPYKCTHCPKAFTASSILRTHLRQHSGERPFKCRHCGRAFASHAAHDSHVKRTHGPAVIPFVCSVCGKGFEQAHERNSHMAVHVEGGMLHNCNDCGRRFSSTSLRDKHIARRECQTLTHAVKTSSSLSSSSNNSKIEQAIVSTR